MIAKKAPHAIHILDRFHVMQKMSKAIDKVRAAEVKQLKADSYEEVLKGGRWLLLKRPENLSDKQAVKLSELLQYNLKSMRSYLMKEDFQQFWTYTYPAWAGKFLDAWCTRAMQQDRAHERLCKNAPQQTRATPQLVPRRGQDVFRRC